MLMTSEYCGSVAKMKMALVFTIRWITNSINIIIILKEREQYNAKLIEFYPYAIWVPPRYLYISATVVFCRRIINEPLSSIWKFFKKTDIISPLKFIDSGFKIYFNGFDDMLLWIINTFDTIAKSA